MYKVVFFLKRVYLLALSFNKQEEAVWKELKKLHTDAEWKSGIYEKEKYIETFFEISKGEISSYYYMIYDLCYHCRVKILDNFPPELTSELFILAAHFNNILTSGVVIVNVKNQYVEYREKRDLLIPLLYSSEIHGQLLRHYNTSKDIYGAFQRLVIEQEAPAIIIADLLKEDKNSENENE